MADSPYPKHFDGSRFFNPGARQARGLSDVLKWKRNSRPQPSPAFLDDVSPSKPPASVSEGELRITLVNHSTVLLQRNGLNILTDPIWSERASPLSWIGPKRRRAPGVRWDDLPPIDLVLLSHNHYDHFDLPTLRRLAERHKIPCVVPPGLADLARSCNLGPVHELDWGDRVGLERVAIHGVPAFHFSARSPFDRNRTLWCGFVIETAGETIYYAGDTGFGDHFSWIRDRFGAPRVALLPIGAYEPRWFMGPIHMSPDEAVRAHRILGAKTSIAIHHGTFQLADEGIDEPSRRLAECVAGEPFAVLNNGQFVTLTA